MCVHTPYLYTVRSFRLPSLQLFDVRILYDPLAPTVTCKGVWQLAVSLFIVAACTTHSSLRAIALAFSAVQVACLGRRIVGVDGRIGRIGRIRNMTCCCYCADNVYRRKVFRSQILYFALWRQRKVTLVSCIIPVRYMRR